jgi:hypothetical protein
MKIMTTHSSATVRETPHATRSTKNLNLNGDSTQKISNALKRRAQSLIKDKSIDAQSRAVIRYGLETNDPWLSELVRRADAGETIIDAIEFSETPETSGDDLNQGKLEPLVELICRAGDEPQSKSAALLVLMATLENASQPKALANTAKHLAFTRCGELNLCGMVDDVTVLLEGELLAGNTLGAD